MQKDDVLNKAIGLRIKEIRTQKNISQEKLAELIGVCNGTHLSNIERGYCGISLPKLVRICKVLNIESDYLLFGGSTSKIETAIHNSLSQLSKRQSKCLLAIINAYLESCDTD